MAAGKTLSTNSDALAADMNTIGQWGLASAIPATEDVIAGSFFYETDTKLLKQEQNGSWIDISGADLSTTDAVVGDVKSGKTFFAVAKPIKTGTLATRTLDPANETVQDGYYEATTLSAVEADLVIANIKYGITIFGKAGHVDVRNVSDANALAAAVKTGRTFYAVGGAKKTGTLPTRTFDPANDIIQDGYYEIGTLSAVDSDLAPANIKSGVTIFGKAGTFDNAVTERLAALKTALDQGAVKTYRTVSIPSTVDRVIVWLCVGNSGVDIIAKAYYNGVLRVTSTGDNTNMIPVQWSGDGAGSTVDLYITGEGASSGAIYQFSSGAWSIE